MDVLRCRHAALPARASASAHLGLSRLTLSRHRTQAASPSDRERTQATAEAETVGASDGASACPVLRALREVPPSGLWRHALEGMLLQTRDPLAYQRRVLAGRSVVLDRNFAGQPMVVISSPEDAREILTSAEPQGQISVGWPLSIELLLGSHSITVTRDHDRHRFLRKVLTRPLRQESIDRYLPTLQAMSKAMLSRWCEASARGEVVRGNQELRSFTFRVISRVVLALQLSERELGEMEALFDQWLEQLVTPFPINRWPFPFAKSMAAREELLRRIRGLIAQARQQGPDAGGAAGAEASLLGELLAEEDEAGAAMSEDQIADNILTLLFAGHDTTSSALTNICLELARRPEVLDRMHQEQRALVAAHGDAMTPRVLRKMAYTEAVMREGLRVHTVVTSLPRTVVRDMEVDGHVAKAGVKLMVPLAAMQRGDPRWQGEQEGSALHPDVFNPERHLGEEGSKLGPAQLYFGAGNRICPGAALAWAEMKAFLAELARGYTLAADTNTAHLKFPSVKPANGLPLFVERRT